MHRQPVFVGSPLYGNGISDKIFNNGLCLPSGSNLSDDEQERIFSVLKKIFRKH
jgi:dTDP-4-amino-4,6-dideoxygalactose transaminase